MTWRAYTWLTWPSSPPKPVTSVPQRRLPPSSSAYVVGVRLGGSGHGVRGSRPLGRSSW